MEESRSKRSIVETYRHRATGYDHDVKLFDRFAKLGFNLSGWRKQAVSALDLKSGDTVLDVGCGTGLSFPLLYRAVGSQGKIIGIDLSEAMLDQARQLVDANC